MKRIAVVAPHPDDEVLGCGGSLLKHRGEGAELHWIIVTTMAPGQGYDEQRMAAREAEIETVARRLGFASVTRLGFPTATLGDDCLGELVARLGDALRTSRAQWVYGPHGGDVHSDHRVVFEAVQSCCKRFRNPWVERVLSYEAVSETEQGLVASAAFTPNVFVDVSAQLEEKIAIMECYAGELGEFPFPRSAQGLRALAAYRGMTVGVPAAEAFMLLREVM